MGKIAKGLFGGSSSKQQSTSTNASWNEAFPQIQQQFSPAVTQGTGAGNAISALLGIGGNPAAQQQAFQKFRDSTGYNFRFNEGQRAITNSNALRGLLNSGATGKALAQYGQGLASSSFNDYLQSLQGQQAAGLGAGNLISGAGEQSIGESQSTGKSSQKKGIGKALGTAAAAIAMSDRRLKKNIQKIYTRDDGLNIYSYDYIYKDGPFYGVMADEAEVVIPEAVVIMSDGYKAVDYSKIGNL